MDAVILSINTYSSAKIYCQQQVQHSDLLQPQTDEERDFVAELITDSVFLREQCSSSQSGSPSQLSKLK